MISAHRMEVTFPEDGKLALEDLPFQAGQKVEIIILSLPNDYHPLKDSVLKYDRPFDPVCEEDWEALK